MGVAEWTLGGPPAFADGGLRDSASSQVERGRYLTEAADCAACHDDPDQHHPFAGGRPIETPFGVVVAANITPELETGIGGWSEAQFEAALREGRGPDGVHLYPAMPYNYYTRMSSADVLAIHAYLRTVAPVRHHVVSDQLPFPFSIRSSMLLWNVLYFSPGEFKPDPSRSSEWNRGAYLVQGPGHCGACHTPKGLLGGDKTGRALQGYSTQGWFAPNITNDVRAGLGAWSDTDVVRYLKSGHNQFAAASGPMGEEVSLSSSHMTDADCQAIAVYLKSLPGRPETLNSLSLGDPQMIAGAAIYADLCSACHRADGSGVPYLIPNLAESSSLTGHDPTTVVRVILQGAPSIATAEEPTAPAMPAFGWQLSDAEVAAVATYISNSWSHAAAPVSEHDVHHARATLAASR